MRWKKLVTLFFSISYHNKCKKWHDWIGYDFSFCPCNKSIVVMDSYNINHLLYLHTILKFLCVTIFCIYPHIFSTSPRPIPSFARKTSLLSYLECIAILHFLQLAIAFLSWLFSLLYCLNTQIYCNCFLKIISDFITNMRS